MTSILTLFGLSVVLFFIVLLSTYYVLKSWNLFCSSAKFNFPVLINFKSVISLTIVLLLIKSVPNLSVFFTG